MIIRNLILVIFLLLSLMPIAGQGQNFELDDEWIFTNQGGEREDEATGVVTDSNGNVYIVGWFSGTINLDPDDSEAGELTSVDTNADPDDINTDIYVAKYSQSGELLATEQLDYKGFNDRANDIALSADESLVYVVGHGRGEVGDDVDIYLASLSASDLTFQKLIQSASPENERGQSVAVNSNGNVYITGYYEKEVELFSGSFGEVSSPFITDAPEQGLFLFVFDKNLSGFVQGMVAKGEGIVRSGRIAVDDEDDVYITGEFSNELSFPGQGDLTSNGGRDIYYAKYEYLDNEFDFAFSVGANRDDRSRSVALAGNSLFITGDFRGTVDFDPNSNGASSIKTAQTLDYDFFVAKYSLEGSFQQVYQAGGLGNDSFEQGFDVDTSNDKVYVTGRVSSITKGVGDDRFFDGVDNTTEADAFLAVFDLDISQPTYVNRFGSNDLDFGRAITSAPNGRVYITGFTDWDRSDPGDEVTKNSFLARFLQEKEDIEIVINDKFSPQTVDSETRGGRDAATADFDANGSLDLAIAFKDGSSLKTYQNNDGTFSSGSALQNDLEDLRAIAIADLDNANGPDIVMTDDPNSGSELRWYRNLGNGSFSAPILITDDYAGSSDVYAGDLDDDGIADILLTNFFTQNLVFFKNLGGTFANGKDFNQTAGLPRALEVGNLNDDNLPDLVVVLRDKDAGDGGTDEDQVIWYRNLGDGNFANPVIIANESHVDSPRGAALADFDGDFDLDVIVVSNENGNITLIENLGNGSFDAPRNIGQTAQPFSVDATDLDGDGDIDIIVGSENDGPLLQDGRVDWFRNDGNFSFTKETLVSVTKGQPNTIVSDDIDNDGDQDLIVAYAEDGEFEVEETNLVLSLTNQIQNNPSPLITDLNTVQGDPGNVIRIFGGNFGSIIGTAQVFFGETEAVVTGVVSEGTELQVVVPEIADGFVNIQVRLPNGNTDQFDSFLVGEEPVDPFISRVNPTENVTVGTEILIEGGGFNPNSTVSLGETNVSVESVNEEGTEIRILVPQLDPAEYTLTVTPGGSTPIVFETKIQIIEDLVPFISRVSPAANVTAGNVITVEGGGFGTNPVVSLDETLITTGSVNPEGTIIRLSVPELSPGDYTLTVTPAGEDPIVFGTQINIIDTPVPTVDSISPQEGKVGTVVTLSGRLLANVGLRFDGVSVTPDQQSDTEVVFTVPDGLQVDQTYTISIVVDEVIEEVGTFRVIDDTDTDPPVITLNTFAREYETGNEIVLSVNVTDNEGGTGVDDQSVKLFFRGLRETDFSTLALAPQGDDVYQVTIPVSTLNGIFDAQEVGLEFYVEASDNAGNSIETNRIQIYRSFPSLFLTGVSPAIDSDNPVENDYQMISIPLESQSINEALGDELGSYEANNTGKWVLFRYSAANQNYQEFQSGFNNFEPGVGYMFAYRDFSGSIELAGQATNLTENSVPITIRPGFNLVGNPFLFGIDWSDILAHNENLGIINSGDIDATLLKWKRGWVTDETNLAEFEGAFVEALGISQPVTLQIPINTNARLGSQAPKNQFNTSLDSESWYLPLNLQSGSQSYQLGGVGMHPRARVSGDRFDNLTPPRFFNSLELNFPHQELGVAGLTKDIVPTRMSYVWDFEVSSPDANAVTINWDNSAFGNNEFQLILLDLETLVQVNLRESSSYQFSSSGKRSFRLFYGTLDDIQAEMQPQQFLVGTPFPNPSAGQVFIPVSVPRHSSSIKVSLAIYNATGQQVASLNEQMSSGYHTLQWDGSDTQGQPVPEGLYIYRIQRNQKEALTGKIIVR